MHVELVVLRIDSLKMYLSSEDVHGKTIETTDDSLLNV